MLHLTSDPCGEVPCTMEMVPRGGLEQTHIATQDVMDTPQAMSAGSPLSNYLLVSLNRTPAHVSGAMGAATLSSLDEADVLHRDSFFGVALCVTVSQSTEPLEDTLNPNAPRPVLREHGGRHHRHPDRPRRRRDSTRQHVPSSNTSFSNHLYGRWMMRPRSCSSCPTPTSGVLDKASMLSFTTTPSTNVSESELEEEEEEEEDEGVVIRSGVLSASSVSAGRKSLSTQRPTLKTIRSGIRSSGRASTAQAENSATGELFGDEKESMAQPNGGLTQVDEAEGPMLPLLEMSKEAPFISEDSHSCLPLTATSTTSKGQSLTTTTTTSMNTKLDPTLLLHPVTAIHATELDDADGIARVVQGRRTTTYTSHNTSHVIRPCQKRNSLTGEESTPANAFGQRTISFRDRASSLRCQPQHNTPGSASISYTSDPFAATPYRPRSFSATSVGCIATTHSDEGSHCSPRPPTDEFDWRLPATSSETHAGARPCSGSFSPLRPPRPSTAGEGRSASLRGSASPLVPHNAAHNNNGAAPSEQSIDSHSGPSSRCACWAMPGMELRSLCPAPTTSPLSELVAQLQTEEEQLCRREQLVQHRNHLLSMKNLKAHTAMVGSVEPREKVCGNYIKHFSTANSRGLLGCPFSTSEKHFTHKTSSSHHSRPTVEVGCLKDVLHDCHFLSVDDVVDAVADVTLTDFHDATQMGSTAERFNDMGGSQGKEEPSSSTNAAAVAGSADADSTMSSSRRCSSPPMRSMMKDRISHQRALSLAAAMTDLALSRDGSFYASPPQTAQPQVVSTTSLGDGQVLFPAQEAIANNFSGPLPSVSGEDERSRVSSPSQCVPHVCYSSVGRTSHVSGTFAPTSPNYDPLEHKVLLETVMGEGMAYRNKSVLRTAMMPVDLLQSPSRRQPMTSHWAGINQSIGTAVGNAGGLEHEKESVRSTSSLQSRPESLLARKCTARPHRFICTLSESAPLTHPLGAVDDGNMVDQEPITRLLHCWSLGDELDQAVDLQRWSSEISAMERWRPATASEVTT